MDFRSLYTNCHKLHLFLPSNHFSTSLVNSNYSRITRIKRKPLFCKPSSPDFDVISTHEHSDGTLLFRFGVPSEVIKNAEHPETVEKEMEKEDKGEYSIMNVNVLDGDREREVEDEAYLYVISRNSISTMERENESSKESFEVRKEIEVPVLESLEVEVSSSPGLDIKNMGFQNEEQEDWNVSALDKTLEIENSNDAVESSENEMASGTTLLNNVSQPNRDIFVTTCVSENENKDSEVKNEITEVGKESDLNEVFSLSNPLEPAMSLSEEARNFTEVYAESEQQNVEAEARNEIIETIRESDSSNLLSDSENSAINLSTESETLLLEIESKLDEEVDSKLKDAVESSENEMANVTTLLNSVFQSDRNILVTTDVSENVNTDSEVKNDISEDNRESNLFSDAQKAECEDLHIEMESVVTRNGSESDTNDTAATSSQLEAAVNVSTGSESESPQLQTASELDEEVANGIVEDFQEDWLGVKYRSEIDAIQLMPFSTQLEAESILYKKTDNDTPDEFGGDHRVESSTTIDDLSQNLTERIANNDFVHDTEHIESSGNEATELESTESAKISEEIVMTDFVLSSGAALLPHPSKVVGEDAYFCTGQTWLGVADGVSQWPIEGTSQGVYAIDLMRNCEKLVSDGVNRPLDLLILSVDKTRSLGSSTVLIAKVDGQTLLVANVGDSGFIILRHGTVYKRSSPMLHLFNFPRRIESGDDPSHFAELYQVDLEEEDVIITATDGLLDNLYDQEISSIIFKCLEADMNLEEIALLVARKAQEVGQSSYSRSPFADNAQAAGYEIAELLAKRAQEVGQSSYSRSPFADNAQAAGYVGYAGGKLDDATVIVSIVKRRPSSESL